MERKVQKSGLESVLEDFSIGEETSIQIQDILGGRVTGRNIAHMWNKEGNLVSYNGRIETGSTACCLSVVLIWTLKVYK